MADEKAAARARWAASSRISTRGRGRGQPSRAPPAPDLPSNTGRYAADDDEAEQHSSSGLSQPALPFSADLRDLLARAGPLDAAGAHRDRLDLEAAWLAATVGGAGPSAAGGAPNKNPLALDLASLERALRGVPLADVLGVEDSGLVTDEEADDAGSEGEAMAAAAAAVPAPPAAAVEQPQRPCPPSRLPPATEPPATTDLEADLDALLDGGPALSHQPPGGGGRVRGGDDGGDWF